MKRRQFLKLSSGLGAMAVIGPGAFAKNAERIDAAWYRQHRRFADLPVSRVAYVEHGSGPAALLSGRRAERAGVVLQ